MPNLQNLFKAIPSTDKCLDALARAAGDGCSPDAVRLLAASPRPRAWNSTGKPADGEAVTAS